MKKLVYLFAIVLAMFAVVSCNGEKEAQSGDTSTDTLGSELSAKDVGYAFGVMMGEQLKSSHLDIDYDSVAKGMKEQSNGKATIDLTAAQSTLQVAFTQANQKLSKVNAEKSSKFLEENGKKAGITTTQSGLQYEVVTEGTGPKPSAEDTVIVNYKGTLIDGTVFDSTEQHGQPAEIPVSRVIPGWVEGIQLMNVGSKYKLYIPSELAYGESGSQGGIEPNQALIFEIELLEIKASENK